MHVRYNTSSHREILACLAGFAGKQVTAGDVYRALRDAGSTVSRATVYRQIDALVDDGVVMRFTPANERQTYLQLVDTAASTSERYQPLKCEKCGKLIYLDCDEIDHLFAHLAQGHGFAVDPRRTIIVGLCEDCREDA